MIKESEAEILWYFKKSHKIQRPYLAYTQPTHLKENMQKKGKTGKNGCKEVGWKKVGCNKMGCKFSIGLLSGLLSEVLW